MIECFYEAHLSDLNNPIEKQLLCDEVKLAFNKSGGDFDHPTKKSIIGAMNELKTFAAQFKNVQIVKKHYSMMMEIVNKMD